MRRLLLTPEGCIRCAWTAAVHCCACDDRAGWRNGAWPLLSVAVGTLAQAVRLAGAGGASLRVGLRSMRVAMVCLAVEGCGEAASAEITLPLNLLLALPTRWYSR